MIRWNAWVFFNLVIELVADLRSSLCPRLINDRCRDYSSRARYRVRYNLMRCAQSAHHPGVTSVLCTYPLELIRVRLAFQTKASDRTTLPQVIRSIANEKSGRNPLRPFYRGFSITILGMIPYAGVSFLTYGTLKRYITRFDANPTTRDLAAGAIAGAVSQTASYPFEVVRRRMQVGGANGGAGVKWSEAVESVLAKRGWRGFFVGLSIGYVKVIPMTRFVVLVVESSADEISISFATWQLLKRVMDI
jgi:solute carrier family 25 protein 16